jgi:UDP-N-acetylglucosamine:LPS N-acetylglucosamine transferase
MQIQYPVHQSILQKVQEMKKKINTKKFCEFHGISESKFSRFPSKKLIDELQLIDYMEQFLDYED